MSNKALIVIDIQQEYVTPGRAFNIQSIEPSLKNAQRMLAHARDQKWPIVHVQHLQEGTIFNRGSEYANFVKGFEPKQGELVVEKGNYSCFSSPNFTTFIEEHKNYEFVVIGYGATMCCLSTIIEGYHRGYQFTLISDACAAKAADELSEESLHQHAVTILKTFARVTTATEEIVSTKMLEA